MGTNPIHFVALANANTNMCVNRIIHNANVPSKKWRQR